jgi:predicted membrane chloride channel (bestrophin family)
MASEMHICGHEKVSVTCIPANHSIYILEVCIIACIVSPHMLLLVKYHIQTLFLSCNVSVLYFVLDN